MLLDVVDFQEMARIALAQLGMVPPAYGALRTVPLENFDLNVVLDVPVVRRSLLIFF